MSQSTFGAARVAAQLEAFRTLIALLLGTTEQSDYENHRLTLEFALANVREHRFLDCDAREVRRNVGLLAERFELMNEDSTSRRIKALFAHFQAQLAAAKAHSGGRSEGDSEDLPYAIVSMLCALAKPKIDPKRDDIVSPERPLGAARAGAAAAAAAAAAAVPFFDQQEEESEERRMWDAEMKAAALAGDSDSAASDSDSHD